MKINLVANVEQVINIESPKYKIIVSNQNSNSIYLLIDKTVTVASPLAIEIKPFTNTSLEVWGAENIHLIASQDCSIDVDYKVEFNNNFTASIAANVEQKFFLGATKGFSMQNTGNEYIKFRVNASAEGNLDKSLTLKPNEVFRCGDIIPNCSVYIFSPYNSEVQIFKDNWD